MMMKLNNDDLNVEEVDGVDTDISNEFGEGIY